MKPLVLKVEDQGDGTSVVTVATVDHRQATVVVPNDALNLPEVEHLYAHVADMGQNAYTARRVSRRDEQHGR